MSESIARRLSPLFLAAIALSSIFAGCTKRIDTSTEAKFYKTWTEVMESLPESRQRAFDEGMSMIWFYSNSDEETYAQLNGKSGEEILAMVEEMKEKLPKLDTSSNEAFKASLEAMRAALPKNKQSVFDKWVRELPAYRPGNPRIDAYNGLMFHKIAENRDLEQVSPAQ